MNYQTLRTYFDTNHPAMVEQIRQLVTQETPSSDKARLDAFAQFLAERFRRYYDQRALTNLSPRP